MRLIAVWRRARDRRALGDEAGFTVVELIVASTILLAALAVFFSSLFSVQTQSSYQTGRARALDDLRITAGMFARDARHARAVTFASSDEVVMDTYVGGTLKSVTYRVVNVGGEIDLERLETGGSPRLFVIKLTDDTIFTFTPTLPALPTTTDYENIRLIGVAMQTRPSTKFPPVVLETEVLLRNVRAV